MCFDTRSQMKSLPTRSWTKVLKCTGKLSLIKNNVLSPVMKSECDVFWLKCFSQTDTHTEVNAIVISM